MSDEHDAVTCLHPTCLCHGDNNNHDKDGKRDAGEDLWNVIYDNGDQEEAKLRKGLRLFREEEGDAEAVWSIPMIAAEDEEAA